MQCEYIQYCSTIQENDAKILAHNYTGALPTPNSVGAVDIDEPETAVPILRTMDDMEERPDGVASLATRLSQKLSTGDIHVVDVSAATAYSSVVGVATASLAAAVLTALIL